MRPYTYFLRVHVLEKLHFQISTGIAKYMNQEDTILQYFNDTMALFVYYKSMIVPTREGIFSFFLKSKFTSSHPTKIFRDFA